MYLAVGISLRVESPFRMGIIERSIMVTNLKEADVAR